VIYGLLANSIALVADAGHNLGDVMGLVMAWAAAVLARGAPSRTYTYGLRRGTVLAALANAVLLLVTVGAIAVEGVRRLIEPSDVASVTSCCSGDWHCQRRNGMAVRPGPQG
jgi:cobalt-zinc-cadmium efflux system protein